MDSGLVVERQVTAESVKRKFLELTERGREYAETQLELETKRRGRGGIVHRYWQHRLKDRFREHGLTEKREVFDADVYVNTGDTELIVEVAMGNNEREVKHVQQHLEKGFDAIWIVCRNEEVRDGIQERLAETGLLSERISFRLVSDVCTAEDGSLA